MNEAKLKDLLNNVKSGSLTVNKAALILKGLPSFAIKEFADIDHSRMARCGFPEAVLCQGKTDLQIAKIADQLLKKDDPVILTRLDEDTYRSVKKRVRALKYDKAASVGYYRKKSPEPGKGVVSILTAGTSDIPVAEEARATLEILGNKVSSFRDAGVAAIHRVVRIVPSLARSRVVIVIAGMDGALPSVVSGLISKPVIAIPTSCGYGANLGGIAPLLTMINSCAPGMAVVNIDNGFGAAAIAHLINR